MTRLKASRVCITLLNHYEVKVNLPTQFTYYGTVYIKYHKAYAKKYYCMHIVCSSGYC
jgi:hypothetical protein